MSRKNDPGLDSWYGLALRLRRISAGMTLKEFSDQVDVSIATVARWETDENAPDEPTVEKIAEALSVLPEDFGRSPRVV